MNEYLIPVVAILMATLVMFTASPASAVAQPYEFHADARMQHETFGSEAKTYGYMNVFTDSHGDGIINVMFSNGSRLHRARFNARVNFLNAAGNVIREEHFNCWIDAADVTEQTECKVSRVFSLTGFDSIGVDFYLSDVPEMNATAAIN